MLDLCSDLVMDNRLLIFADDIDSKLQVVGRLKLVGLRLAVLRRQATAVYKCAVGRLDVAYPDLSLPISPYLCVLPRQHLTVEIAVGRCRDGPLVSLTAYPQLIRLEGNMDSLAIKGAV